MGEARHDCFSQYNADADVVWLQVALPYCNCKYLDALLRWVASGAAVLLGNAIADS